MKDFLILVALLVALIVGAFFIIQHSRDKTLDIFPKPVEDVAESPTSPEIEVDPEPQPAQAPAVEDTRGTATIGLNKKAYFNDITVETWAVLEDSRCPKDVQCIQAGRVVVAVNILSDGTFARTADLKIDDAVIAGKTRITLSAVSPETDSTKKIEDGEYRFTFTFEVIE
jgi:hypothetical protein